MSAAQATREAIIEPPILPRNTVLEGDALTILRTLPSRSVQCVITSPPYFGLRDYGVAGQLGLEASLEEYLAKLVAIFDEVYRVLRKDGTCWVNIGDSYTGGLGWKQGDNSYSTLGPNRDGLTPQNKAFQAPRAKQTAIPTGLKPKDLMLVPFRLALALQAAGWWVRSDIIWSKPNPMPESVTDRPTRSHEYVFLLTRSERYYYDAAAIREPAKEGSRASIKMPDGWDTGTGGHGSYHRLGREKGQLRDRADKQRGHSRRHAGFNDRWDALPQEEQMALGCNKRSVWNVATEPFPESHFATFPTALIEPMVLAGSRPGDVVLDPFMGSGTVGVVAAQHGRDWLGIELNHEYAEMAHRRIAEEGRPVVLKRKQRAQMRAAGVTQSSLLEEIAGDAS